MRRKLFYLSVAMLAFGIGSVVAFNYYWKSNKKLISVQVTEEKTEQTKIDTVEQNENPLEKNIEFFKQKDGFKCQDKFLLTVWNHLRKDNGLKEVFDRGIRNKELSECSEVVEINKLVDLNNDGVNEAVVSGAGWINGANDLSIWIVRKIGKNYKIILEESAVDYEIKAASTNGFQDIFTEHHASCCSSYQTIYKFDNGKYQENKCLFVDYGTTGIKKTTTCAEENTRIEKESRQNKLSSNDQ